MACIEYRAWKGKGPVICLLLQIEFSNIAEQSKRIIADNKLDHIISIVHGKVEDVVALPDGIEQAS